MKLKGKFKDVETGKTYKFILTSVINKYRNEYRLKINGKTVTDDDNYIESPLTYQDEILEFLNGEKFELTEINHFKIDKYLKQEIINTILGLSEEITDIQDEILNNRLKDQDYLNSSFFDCYLSDVLSGSIGCSYLYDLFEMLFDLFNGYNAIYQWNNILDGYMESEREYISEQLENGEIDKNGKYLY